MRCPDGYSLATLQNALRARDILCGRALMFDENRALRLNLGSALGVIPHEECAWGVREGNVRDVALITRVGRTVCFTVQALDETTRPPVATLSRAQAQELIQPAVQLGGDGRGRRFLEVLHAVEQLARRLHDISGCAIQSYALPHLARDVMRQIGSEFGNGSTLSRRHGGSFV